MIHEIELQPLRIVSGWEIEWNQFYEVDPSEKAITYFDSSSLLHLHNKQLKRAIDLDWRPKNDVNGHYYLRVINITKVVHPKTKEINYEGDWEQLYHEFSSKNRLIIVKEIERLLVQTPIFIG
jgi:hypothetical protein